MNLFFVEYDKDLRRQKRIRIPRRPLQAEALGEDREPASIKKTYFQ